MIKLPSTPEEIATLNEEQTSDCLSRVAELELEFQEHLDKIYDDSIPEPSGDDAPLYVRSSMELD